MNGTHWQLIHSTKSLGARPDNKNWCACYIMHIAHSTWKLQCVVAWSNVMPIYELVARARSYNTDHLSVSSMCRNIRRILLTLYQIRYFIRIDAQLRPQFFFLLSIIQKESYTHCSSIFVFQRSHFNQIATQYVPNRPSLVLLTISCVSWLCFSPRNPHNTDGKIAEHFFGGFWTDLPAIRQKKKEALNSYRQHLMFIDFRYQNCYWFKSILW